MQQVGREGSWMQDEERKTAMNQEYNTYHQDQDSYQSSSGGDEFRGNPSDRDAYTDSQPGSPRKTGVGKLVAITLSLVLLAGVAVAGGYSVREIIVSLESLRETASTENIEKELPAEAERETIATNPTVVLNQEATGSVILTDVSEVVENVMPSVVSVTNTEVFTTTRGYGFWQIPQEYYADSCGSGIIVGQNDTELLIVTNNHVIENNVSLTVQFADNSTAEAVVKGADASHDIAILSVALSSLAEETRDVIRIAVLGDSDELKIGQGVIAIGNALGYGQSVTDGIVSALNCEITTNEGTTLKVLQSSAAINPGNSGGALLNVKGEVIGINVAKAVTSDGYSSTYADGMGYAIPISQVKDLMEDMMTWETPTKETPGEAGYLGIQGWTVDSQSAISYGMPIGVYTYSVLEGAPAAEGGVQEKDIIVALEGYTIESNADLQEALSHYRGGDTVTITVARLIDGSYQEIDLSIMLGYRSDYVN